MAENRDKQAEGNQRDLATTPYQTTQGSGGDNPSEGIVRGTGADWFGPLNPMTPTAPEEVKGRQFDMPAGYNLNIRPRAYEPISFTQLRGFADSYDLLRLVIESRKDQMARLRWNIVVRDHAQDRAKDPEILDKIAQIERFFVRPDGEHFWADWIRMVLEDMLVLDAPTIFRRRTYGGQLYALEPIDGSTIKRVVDDWGRTPQYPIVAYQQVLKGFPAIDYTTKDLIYRPRNLRTHKVYGLSPVEQIIMTINIGIRRQVWQLQSFTEGNVPEALIGTPSTWTPDQIRAFQDWFDSMLEGNTGERRRARFVPGEISKGYVATKPSELFGQAEEWLARVVCYAFSVSPQPFVAMMNRSTAETAQETAVQEGLAPIQQWVKGLIDSIIMDDFGSSDLEFEWFDEEELDPSVKSAILDRDLANGTLTFNEVRAEKGLDPYDHPDADRPMFKTVTGYTPIFATPEEEADAAAMQAQISGQAPGEEEPGDDEPPKGTPPGGGEPKGPPQDENNEGGKPISAAPGEQNPASKMAKADHANCPACLAKGEWDEDAHPRDENGRFGSGGGSDGESDKEEGEGRYTQAQLDSAMKGVAPNIAAVMTPEQVADLKGLIANGADQETILAAMEPIYAAVPDLPPSLSSDVQEDDKKLTEFFDSRTYNVPDEVDAKGNVVSTKEVGYDEAINALIDNATGFAGPEGVGFDKEATIILGPSAAGKSGFAEELATATRSAIVDSDEAKKIIPEYEHGLGAPVVHAESGVMNEAVEKRLVDAGANVIIPKVGHTESSIAKIVTRFEEAGYKVNLVNVKVDKDEATRRMSSRALAEGRAIPADYMRAIGNNPTQTYNSLKGRVSGYAEIEASGPRGSASFTENHGYRGAGNAGESAFGKADHQPGGSTGRQSLFASGGRSPDVHPGSDGCGEVAASSGSDEDLVWHLTKGDLAKAVAYINPDRKKAKSAERKLKLATVRILRSAGKNIARQVLDKLKELGKADDAQDLIDSLDLSMFEDLEGDLADSLEEIYADSGKIAIGQMGAKNRGELVNQVNERSVSWAKDKAAELVGRSDNPAYALTDSTRDMLRSTIANGLESNLSAEDIAAQIEEAYAFSSDRAELIAMTEIAAANSEGALDGYKEAADLGIEIKKSWLMLEDACDVCQENADEGPIDLDEEFPSGDMAPPGHPNCRCVIVPEVQDGEAESEDNQGEGLESSADFESGDGEE